MLINKEERWLTGLKENIESAKNKSFKLRFQSFAGE
jgi:hypothetical protein